MLYPYCHEDVIESNLMEEIMKLSLHYLRIIVLIPVVCYAMENPGPTLDSLPSECIGKIVEQLVDTTGTPAIYNDKDIPVIIKYIKRLSFGNRGLYNTVNGPHVTSIILTKLSDRFGISKLDAAAFLKTPGGKEWVKDNVVTLEYKLFETVQSIRNMVDVTMQDHEKRVLGVPSGHKEVSDYNQCHNQTDKGIFLAMERRPQEFCPKYLYTPWGEVEFKQTTLERDDDARFTQDVLQKLSITPPVVDRDKNRAIYPIRQFDGEELSEPAQLPYHKQRKYESVAYLWKLLKARYNEEHGIKEGANLKKMNLDRFSLTKSILKPTSYPLENLSHLPRWIASYMQKILAQPKQTHPNSKYPFYVLSADHQDAHILQGIIGIKRLIIRDSQRDPEIKLSANVPNSIADPQTHQHIVDQLISGWHAASLVDYPDIHNTKSEEEWYIFVKDKCFLSGEDTLMRFIASKLGLEDKMWTDNTWKHPSKAYEFRESVYLWIKKDGFDEVMDKIPFQITYPVQN